MSDRCVVTFYYDYEKEDRWSGKKRVRGLVSKEYGVAWLVDLIPFAYNGIKFFLDRCNHRDWDFSMDPERSRWDYDALNASFDTFFDKETIGTGRDLVGEALKRAEQNLYGHMSDGELLEYMFGFDIFWRLSFSYTGTLKDGCVLKYGILDQGYSFEPWSLWELLEQKDRDRVMAEKLFSYQGSEGSFDISVNPDDEEKLYVISVTDGKGNESERLFNRYDLDVNDMDYPEFCAFMLLSAADKTKIKDLITDDYFVNAEGFNGLFDRGERMDLLAGFIDKHKGTDEELVKEATWGYRSGYDHYRKRKMLEFFEQNAQLFEDAGDCDEEERKGWELIKEKIGEPKRQYETLAAGKTGPICDWQRERESDDDPIEEAYLSVLTYNCLKENNVNTIGEMKAMTFEQLNEMKNIPLRSKVEILEKFYFIHDYDGSVCRHG